MKEFQWFSGLGVKAAKDAVESLDLVPVEAGSDRMLLGGDAATFREVHTARRATVLSRE